MSGIGKRFIDAGYEYPKPLIEIDGKPIIEYVVGLFPGETKFTFICNQTHLDNTHMRETLERIAPSGDVLSIAPHKLGPVFAVSQIIDRIDDEEEVIVNYCDFGTYWDYNDFLNHCRVRKADGAIPAYKRFHPHMLGSTNYAFMRDEVQWMQEIKEKEPFTDNRMEEFASNGTYYFRRGEFVKKYFNLLMEKDINLKGEYYVSLIYNLMVEDGLSVSIYDVQHMLQWGTPQDVEEYLGWSNYFKQVMEPKKTFLPLANSLTLIPLAGAGSRFVKEGYADPKPLIDVSGKPMIIQANAYLPKSEMNAYVVQQTHCDEYQIDQALLAQDPNALITKIDGVTEGQAITCELGLKNIDDKTPLLIAACDNGMLWNSEKYQSLIDDKSIDAIIWTFKNHSSAINNPQMYGWVNTQGEKAIGVSVKNAVSDNPGNDHAVVGTFFIREKQMFDAALKELTEKNIRVNGEFYVDSLMDVLVGQGKNVVVFEVDSYICWGTPDDYRTFEYWQSFFHKTKDHPYDVFKDPTVNPEKMQTLNDRFFDFKQEHK
tara:strand:+ start:8415 stop:10040 length:1626 start_codon:yes stop_codon:yes gene_type:complete